MTTEEYLARLELMRNRANNDWSTDELQDETGDTPGDWAEALRLAKAAPALLDTLTLALPYVEMAEDDRAYKPGVVKAMVRKIREAIEQATAAPAAGTGGSEAAEATEGGGD